MKYEQNKHEMRESEQELEESKEVSEGVCLCKRSSSVWQAINKRIGHFVWSPLPRDHHPVSSSHAYTDGGRLHARQGPR